MRLQIVSLRRALVWCRLQRSKSIRFAYIYRNAKYCVVSFETVRRSALYASTVAYLRVSMVFPPSLPQKHLFLGLIYSAEAI